jgi:hypothetical protein
MSRGLLIRFNRDDVDLRRDFAHFIADGGKFPACRATIDNPAAPSRAKRSAISRPIPVTRR